MPNPLKISLLKENTKDEAVLRELEIDRMRSKEKLTELANNLQAILDNTSEGFLLINHKGIVKAFNNKAAEYAIFSSEKKMAAGDCMYHFIEKYRVPIFKDIVSRALKGEHIKYDRCYDLPDGKQKWIHFSVKCVAENAQVTGVCITGRNITKQKIAEQQLEFNNNNLNALINNTKDLMWSVDKNFKLLTSNHAFKALMRNAFGNVTNQEDFILGNHSLQKQLLSYVEYYKRALAGETFTITDRYDYPEVIWSEISFYPIVKDKDIVGTACFSRDITKEKKAEQKIKFDTNLLNVIGQAVIVTDTKGSVIYWNKAAEKTYGWSAKEAIGQSVLDLTPAWQSIEQAREIMDELKKGNSWSGEFIVKGKDGNEFPVFLTDSPIFNDEGDISSVIGVSFDITERKKTEQKVKLLDKKILAQKVEQQKKITRAIIKAQEAERSHLGRELHDNVKQILAGAKIYLGLAARKNQDVNELVKYPMELIDSSMEEIRILSHKQVLPQKNIDLQNLVQSIIDDFNTRGNVQVAFQYKVPQNSISDELRLNVYRVIQEQVNNISKYAEAKNIAISIETVKKILKIIVKDDGKGFTLKGKREGIGISNMIHRVEAYNGRFTIKSNPGNGCKITIQIPL